MNKKTMWIILIVAVIIGAIVAYITADIGEKKGEQTALYQGPSLGLSDNDPRLTTWGKQFPDYLDMYMRGATAEGKSTEFGGNIAYNKLERFPQLVKMWAGYPFSVDANEERHHFFIQADQMKTARNNKDFLNAAGFKAFGGQPTACMNCHSGWTSWLLENVSKGDFLAFNSSKYWTMIKNVPVMDGEAPDSEAHTGLHGGTRMGLACADCHSPKDMSLRITRPALVNALVARGYEADETQGIKASRQEMRTLVCSQCHVEYYFAPAGKVTTIGESIANDPNAKWLDGTQKTYEQIDYWRNGNKPTQIEVAGTMLTFPWSEWKKGEPFRIEMFDDYYEKIRDKFPQDWVHKDTKAPMLKIQHPETELASGGIHAKNGVSCADCHMPYTRNGAKKVTSHQFTSPLNDVNASCKTCHRQSEDYLKQQVYDIQTSVASMQRNAEYAIVSLIEDVKSVRAKMGAMPKYQTDGKADDVKISKALSQVLDLHRKSQMRADFVNAENSTGFHNPQEASRIMGQSIAMAKEGQALLVSIAAQDGINITPSNLGFKDIQKFAPGELKYPADMEGHKKGELYYNEPDEKDVNRAPSKNLLELDENLAPYNYTKINKPLSH
ncbi:cytochrome C [Helicobacter sp. CLO-3]|uniref:ammonia-forming cytochrome c nitrite reductase subunit c552 n=1 Tax=unclassified Helicobacter TaxID=2593540 RepID=UPI000805A5FD|nr:MULTISPECIES: ammonia-forming cytochrome c nitrite reductase subunit c552 [unclassified Helicobacter]OBV28829.1 cytochrome C [Helicobacter sp. CLO-3]OHU81234.1 cytochrome C [Helicobacter sp. CLO-3]